MQSLFGLYAQDRWTVGRLSLAGGLRFEHLSDHFGEQQIGPNTVTRRRGVSGANRATAPEGPAAALRCCLRCVREGKDRGEVLPRQILTTFNTVDEWATTAPPVSGILSVRISEAGATTTTTLSSTAIF